MVRTVVAVVTTKNRPQIVRRLLAAIRQVPEVSAVYVNDNSGRGEAIVDADYEGPEVACVTAGRDLGCGGGLAYALEQARQHTAASFFWILDDDAVPRPDALSALLAAHATSGKGLLASAIVNEENGINIFSGPMDRNRWQALKRGHPSPEEFCQRFGGAPVPVNWSSWVSMLITREAFEQAGPPRSDFWFQGEDLEFAMRIIRRQGGAWVPRSVCAHLPPAPADAVAAKKNAFLKYCALVQNTTYTFLHLAHGRPALRHLPGNYVRFFRYFGFSTRNLAIAARLFWLGAIRREPAGHRGFQQYFRKELTLG